VVKGLDLFRKHFDGYADQFILIGGTAATLAMEQARASGSGFETAGGVGSDHEKNKTRRAGISVPGRNLPYGVSRISTILPGSGQTSKWRLRSVSKEETLLRGTGA